MPQASNWSSRGPFKPPTSSKRAGKPGTGANTKHMQVRTQYSRSHVRTKPPSGGGLTEKKWMR